MLDKSEISAIIIDDDPEAINLLEIFLHYFQNITIIGKSTDAKAGLGLIIELFPDIIFLDVDMPDMTGLQVAESVRTENLHSEIVFTTAYQNYAYNALSIEPLDFLTKPFCLEDLENVINKYIARKEKKKQEQKLDKFRQSQGNVIKVKLPTYHSYIFVDLNDIVYIKSNTNGTYVYLQDGTFETVTRNLNSLILLLNSSLIFQINRSTCVNLNYLYRIDKKKEICILRYNQKLFEESISRNNILNFEKLNIFPSF
ncbi:MAG: LytTR family DNA-binding domain-containing protein [Bacteroidota bacterium]|nr:LytTR family DNA-binding domain-containing protein [Bacteroidota bacterium]